jgi:hypothetical protein
MRLEPCSLSFTVQQEYSDREFKHREIKCDDDDERSEEKWAKVTWM